MLTINDLLRNRGLTIVIDAFLETLLMFWSVGIYTALGPWWLMALVAVVALFFCVGETNFINFMDGINGITVAYALAMLVPIAIVNEMPGLLPCRVNC